MALSAGLSDITPWDQAHTHRLLALGPASGICLEPYYFFSTLISLSPFFPCLLSYPLALLALVSTPTPLVLSILQLPLPSLAEPDCAQPALTLESSSPGSFW